MSPAVFVVGAKRTPHGAFCGALKSFSAPDLGAVALRGAIECVDGLTLSQIQAVYMGCTVTAGMGQGPARQVALKAGLPVSTHAVQINKVCGSAMQALIFGCLSLQDSPSDSVVAGGMESMSQMPYLLPRARAGYRMGHGELVDSLVRDGLESAGSGNVMGLFADQTAQKQGFSRAEQDTYACTSANRSLGATQEGWLKEEIIPIPLNDALMDTDETLNRVKLDKIPALKPVFHKEGTITAATASALADGASALVLMTEQAMTSRRISPLARICGWAVHAQEPENFATAPEGAIERLLKKVGWAVDDVDLFEVNEAFAVVPLYVMRALQIPAEKINVWGGACALGHPLGSSGTRILVTLIHALHFHNKRRGIAALCIGGGEAIAVAVEIP